jgi:tRNA threonylcarbamoyladenosine biosynthesis protein TsaB
MVERNLGSKAGGWTEIRLACALSMQTATDAAVWRTRLCFTEKLSLTVLAFDCSTQNCSVAALRQGRVLAWRSQAMARGQSEALMPMVEAVLGDAGLTWTDLSLIGATVGPGTFTGIRIGLAAARGMALAGQLAIAGVGTCEAIAHAVPPEERRDRILLVAVDSKRADLFVQAFGSDLTPLGPPCGMAPAEAILLASGALLLAGDGARRLLALRPDATLSPGTEFPDARIVARLAERYHAEGRALPLEPIYLRAPDVTISEAGHPTLLPRVADER